MIKLKNVSKYYYQDGVVAAGFSKINLELNIGEFVVITGESGSGKSTLLNVISGLDTYEDGEMYINGEETSHYSEEDYLLYRRKYVSNIFQNFNLINSYTVYENIELAMLLNGKSKKEIRKNVKELIDKVGMTKYSKTKVSKLSGGQKQRVAIARALAYETPIIVADEPTGSLDSKSSEAVLKLLHDISKDKLVVVVTHNKEEIEKYATRLIRMNDGKIIENKEIVNVGDIEDIKLNDGKEIGFFSKIYYGIKNAFNIPIKFLLMFIIFILISITLLSEYSSFKKEEIENSTYGYNMYFNNTDDRRIIIKKENKGSFKDSDFEFISSINGVNYITKNDLLNDFSFSLYKDDIYLYGVVRKNDLNSVDEGRLPVSPYEIIIKGDKDDWYLSNYYNEIFNSTFESDNLTNGQKFTVVGIIYNEKSVYDGKMTFYLSDEALELLSSRSTLSYTSTSVRLNNNSLYIDNYSKSSSVIASNKVKRGEVYISDNHTGHCTDFYCINKDLTIKTSNIYVSNSKSFKVTKVYNKNNIKSLVDYKYEEYNGSIFINEEDYNEIYPKDIYQSSVFVKGYEDIDKVAETLNNNGYTTLKLRDAKNNEGEVAAQIIKIFKLVVTIALIFTLFFISYFIIKIIYKSRNSYYTTIRTLGGTKKVCISVLRNELYTLATFSYAIFILLLIFVNKDIIKYNSLKNMIMYVNIYEYIMFYIILILLSFLISNRYGRKIFKKSIIKTYGERI